MLPTLTTENLNQKSKNLYNGKKIDYFCIIFKDSENGEVIQGYDLGDRENTLSLLGALDHMKHRILLQVDEDLRDLIK